MTNLEDFFLSQHVLTFSIIWPVNCISNLRALILLFIALDRTFATYLPITFFKFRKFIPTCFIVTFVLSYVLVDSTVLFLICGIDLSTPINCMKIQCILGTCYQNYWLNFERVVYMMIVVSTFLLTFKLLIWNRYKKQNISKNLKKVNHLALIECCILILFELLPPTVQSLVPDPLIYLGAIISACQTLGFVVESILVTVNLEKKYKTTNVVNIGKLMFQSTAGNTSEAQ